MIQNGNSVERTLVQTKSENISLKTWNYFLHPLLASSTIKTDLNGCRYPSPCTSTPPPPPPQTPSPPMMPSSVLSTNALRAFSQSTPNCAHPSPYVSYLIFISNMLAFLTNNGMVMPLESETKDKEKFGRVLGLGMGSISYEG